MTTFTYGMEFEVEGITPNRASDALNDGGIDCERVDSDIHADGFDSWKAVYDGSLSNGAEVVSPILTDARLNEAHKVANLLADAGARVGRSTGFHIHIGADTFNRVERVESATDAMARFVLNYYGVHHAIAALVAPSRLRNRFCQILGETDAKQEAEWVANGNLSSRFNSRYYSLNLESLQRHGTLEIRLHQGTLNGVKAIAWAQFVASLITATKRGADLTQIEGITPWAPVYRGGGEKSPSDCRTLLDYLVTSGDLKPSAGDWLKNRADKLNG